MTEELAVFGGPKFIKNEFNPYQSIGEEEIAAALGVLESGNLSQFVGSWGPDFFGGPKVQEFEKDCSVFFGTKHAVAVNSWTSGLVAAVGAIGVSPGDEVILPTWTMTASAAAVLHWSGIPVFADIDPETFCIDVDSVEKLITARTVAIMTVDIFGQSSDIYKILALAKSRGLKVISDTAQAPAALVGGKYAGTIADIGGISLNYHKHIHTGEGGVLFTDDDGLALRMRLIRNHAEAVVADISEAELDNMIGHNFRLGEIEGAIGSQQLKKLKHLAAQRRKVASKLYEGLHELSGLNLPQVAKGNTHVYYVFGMTLSGFPLEIGRFRIARALEAEGVRGLMQGYANVHMLPAYQNKIAFGKHGFPWTSTYTDNTVSYERGICPVSEVLHDSSFLGLELCISEYNDEEVESVVGAFQKVWRNLNRVRDIGETK